MVNCTSACKVYTICYHINTKYRMAKQCPICEKGSQVGGGYSNRVRATQFNPIGKRRRQPNLQWATSSDGSRTKICTRCMKAGKHLKVK